MERSELKVGDHIYSWRSQFAFKYGHHGIYVGENKVIHFTGKTETNSSSSGFSSASSGFSSASSSHHPITRVRCSDPECHQEPPSSNGGVIKSCLDCFLQTRPLCRYQYEVSSQEFRRRKRGTCTTIPSDPPNIVVARATAYLAKNNFGDYHLLENNCEDFALRCTTGCPPHEMDPENFRCQISDLLRFVSYIGSFMESPKQFMRRNFSKKGTD